MIFVRARIREAIETDTAVDMMMLRQKIMDSRCFNASTYVMTVLTEEFPIGLAFVTDHAPHISQHVARSLVNRGIQCAYWCWRVGSEYGFSFRTRTENDMVVARMYANVSNVYRLAR